MKMNGKKGPGGPRPKGWFRGEGGRTIGVGVVQPKGVGRPSPQPPRPDLLPEKMRGRAVQGQVATTGGRKSDPKESNGAGRGSVDGTLVWHGKREAHQLWHKQSGLAKRCRGDGRPANIEMPGGHRSLCQRAPDLPSHGSTLQRNKFSVRPKLAQYPSGVLKSLQSRQMVKDADIDRLKEERAEYIVCPLCRKVVPLITAQIDHSGTSWSALLSMFSDGVPSSVAFDLNNLRYLCPRCNASNRHNLDSGRPRTRTFVRYLIEESIEKKEKMGRIPK